MFLTPGGRDKNELPIGTDPAHLAEQQNLVSSLTRRSKTDAWTLNVRWALIVRTTAASCVTAEPLKRNHEFGFSMFLIFTVTAAAF